MNEKKDKIWDALPLMDTLLASHIVVLKTNPNNINHKI